MVMVDVQPEEARRVGTDGCEWCISRWMWEYVRLCGI